MKVKVTPKTVIVLCISAVLVGGMIFLFATANHGYDEEVTGRNGEVRIGGTDYNRKPLTTVLFIGVGDAADEESNPEAVYLTLLSIDSRSQTYFTMNLPCDSVVTVYPYKTPGVFSEDGIEQRLGQAQSYGDGQGLSCLCTVRAVSALLHGVTIDYYVCLSAASGEPAFLQDVAAQLNQIQNALETSETQEQESATDTPAPYLYMSLTRSALAAIANQLAECTFDGSYTPRGDTIGGASPRYILDKQDLDAYLVKYFFERVSGT